MKKFLYIGVAAFIFSLFGGGAVGLAQNTDSLWSVYNNKSQADTNRLHAIHAIAWSLVDNKPDTAIILAEQEVQLANALSLGKGKKWLGRAFITIGVAFKFKGNYPKALEYYLKALKLSEEISDKKSIGNCYNNIGIVYNDQANYVKALDYYLKSLKILEEAGYKKGMSNCYSNIGLVYYNLSNYPKALEYYLKDLKICEETGDKNGLGISYISVGNVYAEQSDFKKALLCFFKAVKINVETGNKQGLEYSYLNMGGLNNKLANYKLAIQYSDSCLQITKEIGDIFIEREAYANLATAYSKTGRYKEAYNSHVKFKMLTDSIFNTDNSRLLGDMKTKFEVEKKEAELKVKSEAEQEKLKAVSLEEKKRQRVIIYAVAGVLLLVSVFSLFLFNRFRITQRQKNIIEKQKVHVDTAYEKLHEKNKEVMDSIYYARRIQTALLPSEKYVAIQLNRLMKN